MKGYCDSMKFTIFQNGFVDCEEIGSFQVESSQSTRSDNTAGLYNYAVELIISRRFQFQLSLLDGFLKFPELNLEIELYKFCEIGGFDESEQLYFYEEFKLRSRDFIGSNKLDVGDLKDSSFKQKLSLLTNKDSKENFQLYNTNVIENTLPYSYNSSDRVTIGVTVGDIQNLQYFLDSFHSSFEDESDQFSFVVCCFGVDKRTVANVFANFKISENRIKILEEEWGFSQAKSGNFGEWFLQDKNCSGVSYGRCVLHRALFEYSKDDIIWILDDDIEFLSINKFQLWDAIFYMREKKLQVGIGAIIGDAPLPPPYVIRTQAVDFYYANFAKHKRIWNCDEKGEIMHDIHHDLSTTRSDHLEVPHGIGKAFGFPICDWSIFSGKSITRPIHSEWETFDGIPTRGGNTLLLSKNPLVWWPNVSPMCGGIQFRRGDTIWAKLIERDSPELIGSVKIALTQVRNSNIESFSSVEKIRGDIFGSMFTRALGCKKPEASKIIRKSELRESRLLMNLIRAHYILCKLSYEKSRLVKLKQLISDIEKTPLSETMCSDLDKFIIEFSDKINTFRIKG